MASIITGAEFCFNKLLAESQHLSHKRFILLCLLFWGMTRLHTSVLSPFEGPDEVEHFAYVLKLRQTGTFPTYDDFETPIRQQVGQAPLYYVTASLFSLPLYSADGLDAGRVKLNPWVGFSAPATSTDNRNYAMMHPAYQALEPDQRRLSETLWATRGISVFFGWLALFGIYWGGLALWQNRSWALLAAMLFGFAPPILQTFSVLTNDAAVVAFSTLVLAASLHLFTRWNDRRLLVITALLISLAGLSKVSGLVMGIIPVIAVLLGWWQTKRDYSELLKSLVILAFIPAVLAGWWYVRSYLLYGDLLGTAPHQQMSWGFAELQPVHETIKRLPIIAQTMWFNAGWGEVRPETWGYILPTAAVVVSLIGWGLKPRRFNARFLMLLFTLIIGFVALIRWMQMADLITGRLYLPYTPAFALLIVWGVKTAPLASMWKMLLAGASGGLSIITAVTVIFPAFGAPALLDQTPEGLSGEPLNFAVGHFIGYKIDSDVLRQGEDRHVTLCWQAADGETPVPYPFALQVIEAADRNQVQAGELIVASRESYPGLGKYTLWQKIFCDRFRLPVEKPLQLGREYVLYLTLFDPVTLAGLPAYIGDQPASKIIGHLRADRQP